MTAKRNWLNQLGGIYSKHIDKIATDKQANVWAIGGTSGDIHGITRGYYGGKDVFISKYDADGDRKWTKLLFTNGGSLSSIAINGDNIKFIAHKPGVNREPILSRIDSNGNTLWQSKTTIEQGGGSFFLDANDSSGVVYAGSTRGNYGGQVNASKATPWETSDTVLIKYKNNGEISWSRLM